MFVLVFLFIASFLATFLIPTWNPSIRLFFFAPFLAMFIYKNKLSTALWMAFFLGLFLDLLTSGDRLGLLTLNIVMTVFFLFRLQPYFFEDALSTLPIITFLFGTISASLHLLFDAIFKMAPPFSIPFQDLFIMPFWDALWGLFLTLLWNVSRHYLKHVKTPC